LLPIGSKLTIVSVFEESIQNSVSALV